MKGFKRLVAHERLTLALKYGQFGCIVHGLPLPCSECLYSAQMMYAAFGLLGRWGV